MPTMRSVALDVSWSTIDREGSSARMLTHIYQFHPTRSSEGIEGSLPSIPAGILHHIMVKPLTDVTYVIVVGVA